MLHTVSKRTRLSLGPLARTASTCGALCCHNPHAANIPHTTAPSPGAGASLSTKIEGADPENSTLSQPLSPSPFQSCSSSLCPPPPFPLSRFLSLSLSLFLLFPLAPPSPRRSCASTKFSEKQSSSPARSQCLLPLLPTQTARRVPRRGPGVSRPTITSPGSLPRAGR